MHMRTRLNPPCKKAVYKANESSSSKYPSFHFPKEKKTEMKKISALVVDDDPLIRRVEEALLGRFGVETKAAENGKEAVDLFMAGDSFDLVFMDREMPLMDGPKATRALRGMGVSCMIVGVTAGGEAEKAAFVAAGLDCCWDKPLSAQIVVAMLDELANKIRNS